MRIAGRREELPPAAISTPVRVGILTQGSAAGVCPTLLGELPASIEE
jgi:hypothetical protein